MNLALRTVVAGWLVLFMVANVAGQGAPKAASGDVKEIASYRLTMEAVRKVEVATRAMIAEMKADPRIQARMKLEAEIETLEKKDELTDAEQEQLDALVERRERMDAEQDLGFGNAQSLVEMEARIQKFPPMANGLRKAGMSPREYATFMMAMVQAAMVAGFKKAGMLKELPPDVNPENVRFVEEHEAELKAMQAEWEKLSKGVGG